ncbi:MAG: efflux RND transporter periplasmic adaptor subunit [Muribaculaceae bacterium]|nr:efflux RND transporter periplasmic adaptor subunit [Muribaculaceae bacterium]
MKKEKFLTLGNLYLSLCLIASMFTSCGGGGAQQQMPSAVQVETMKLAVGASNLDRAYPVVIKGKVDVDIRPQVSGFITKVCVNEGQSVRKGQLLFVIDQVQLEAAVRSAEAVVVAAKSVVSTNELTVANKKSLREKNIISDYEYQTAVLALASAKAQLHQADQSLVNARKNLSYSNVSAPFDGVVGSIPNREGTLASPSGQALTTISDISDVYAYFSLNEKEILALTNSGSENITKSINGMPPVSLILADGSRYPITGKIETISGVFDQNTGSASARAIFKNTNNMLRSGSTGTILIPNPQSNVITIPQGATYEIQDKKFVYLVGDSSKAVSTPIEISSLNDGKTYIVTSGLKAGDELVIEGVGTKVKAGTVIAPIAPTKNAQEAPAK